LVVGRGPTGLRLFAVREIYEVLVGKLCLLHLANVCLIRHGKGVAAIAGLTSPALDRGGSVIRRLKLILAVTTVMATLLAINAGPALADDDGCIGPRWDNGRCIGVETDRDHHDWNDWDRNHWDWNDWDWNNRHDWFINDFDEFDDFDCEFAGWDGDEAIYVCEVDFDW
jgi:hypothetical protein